MGIKATGGWTNEIQLSCEDCTEAMFNCYCPNLTVARKEALRHYKKTGHSTTMFVKTGGFEIEEE